MERVNSTEFQQKFGHYRDLALQTPVSITSYGRDSLVLMSAQEYKRLKERFRQALLVEELSEEHLKAIRDAEPPEHTKQFDHEIEG